MEYTHGSPPLTGTRGLLISGLSTVRVTCWRCSSHSRRGPAAGMAQRCAPRRRPVPRGPASRAGPRSTWGESSQHHRPGSDGSCQPIEQQGSHQGAAVVPVALCFGIKAADQRRLDPNGQEGISAWSGAGGWHPCDACASSYRSRPGVLSNAAVSKLPPILDRPQTAVPDRVLSLDKRFASLSLWQVRKARLGGTRQVARQV